MLSLALDSLSETWRIVASEFPFAVWETLYATVLSTALSAMLGLPLGVLLSAGGKHGILPLPPWLLRGLNVLINVLRSIPFLILMILVIPLTRFLLGRAYGTMASVVPLVIAAFPFVARLVESSLSEVPKGLIEAARSMGASPLQIIIHVLLRESVPSLLANLDDSRLYRDVRGGWRRGAWQACHHLWLQPLYVWRDGRCSRAFDCIGAAFPIARLRRR